MSDDPDVPTIVPGSILLERYRADRVIGVGGMGVVVGATHTTLGNYVAIKFLLPKFATSNEAAQRFIREAKAASKIQSEHVARVLDTGSSPDLGPFIVMEYLEGGDLSRHLKGGHVFAVAEAIDFIIQACEALAHAHTSGIVHRDVKPANLFLGTRGDGLPIVKVLDFGISKVVEDSNDMAMTKTTAILGSGYYMSPEQMRSSKNVDHRTDIYGLGVTLYELLTRTVPFQADTFADLAIKVAVDPPDPITRHRNDVSAELAAAIERAYAKKPEHRYQNVAELALSLAPWAAVETLPIIESIQRICGSPHARMPSLAPGRGSLPPGMPGYSPPAALPPPARLPSIPPPYLGGPASVGSGSVGGGSVGGSGRPGDVSQPALALTTGAPKGRTMIGAALALATIVGVGIGAGLYVRTRSAEKGGAEMGAASSASADVLAAEPPPAASAEPASSGDAPTPAPTAEPAASASAVPSASGAPSATVAGVAPRVRPPRTAAPSAAAPPAPPKLCEAFNPEKGLRELVPCP